VWEKSFLSKFIRFVGKNMKKIIALSLLLGITGSTILAVQPSFAQTVTVPISGGVLNVGYDGLAVLRNFQNSTVLTPLGSVSINAFNGNLTRVGGVNGAVTASNFNLFDFGFDTDPTSTLQFNGTTDGTSPTGAFTNTPTTITSTFVRANFPAGGPYPDVFGATTVTGGSITLPAPPPVTCEGCLIVRPEDLLIANSTFLSPDSQEPEYRQEYKNDFSASSFRGGRILGLEDK
jgi:hypothetical protein